MLKTLLIIPPKYGTTYPPLGTAALSGYLKSKGVDAKQVDWNIEYHTFNNSEDKDKRNHRLYEHLLPLGPVNELPYGDNTYSSFYFTESLLSSPLLFPFINDSVENPFHRFIIEKKLIDKIVKWQVEIVGISITSPSQVIFSFTLGYLLKKFNSRIHRVIGGQWVSLYRNQIIKRKDFMEFFDSAVIFEGETAFFKLIHTLFNNTDLSKVPNLIYRKDSCFVLTKFHSRERLDELPCPDFDGLPVDKYKGAPERGLSLTFETSRECYWNRCIYCVDLPHPKQGYRIKNPQLAVRDIRHLLNRYPTLKTLIISDPAISPTQMFRISKEIIKQDLKISWWCFARPDGRFSKELFEIAKRAGCYGIDFGLETNTQRLLDLVQKGVNLEMAKEVLKNCHKAGIKVNLQIILGLPTETFEEALNTITFLVENNEILEDIFFNIYYLTRGCLIYEDPLRYGVVPDDASLPFQFFIEFSRSVGGFSKEQARALMKIYYTLIKDMRNRDSIKRCSA